MKTVLKKIILVFITMFFIGFSFLIGFLKEVFEFEHKYVYPMLEYNIFYLTNIEKQLCIQKKELIQNATYDVAIKMIGERQMFCTILKNYNKINNYNYSYTKDLNPNMFYTYIELKKYNEFWIWLEKNLSEKKRINRINKYRSNGDIDTRNSLRHK